jgi:hypothetical protein
MSSVLDDVILAPLLAEEMPNDAHRQCERQAVVVGAHILGKRPRCFH